VLGFSRKAVGTQHSAISIQPALQFGAVLTGILSSQVAVMGTKTLNHRGRGGAQRKTFFCRRVARMSADLKAKPETMEQFLERRKNGKPTPSQDGTDFKGAG
jgi:hypothetical protein